MNTFSRFLPLGVIVLASAYLITTAMPVHDDVGLMQVHEFARLPVVDRGRVKPIDTVARHSLMVISERQSFKDGEGKSQPAIRWLLDVMTTQSKGESAKIRAFHIDNEQVRELLGLRPRPGSLYAFEEFGPRAKDLIKELDIASRMDAKDRTAYHNQVIEVALQAQQWARFYPYERPHKIFRIDNDQLVGLLGLEPRPGSHRYSYAEFVPRIHQLIREASRAGKLDGKQQTAFDAKVVELAGHVQVYLGLARLENLRMVPPTDGAKDWKLLDETLDNPHLSRTSDPAAFGLRSILSAYAQGDARSFNKELGDYQDSLSVWVPEDAKTTGFEVFFNQFAPFYRCMVLYVIAFLLVCMTWLGISEAFNRAAFWLIVLTLVIHTIGLVARMHIQGRPPVTNLYSSAVFIGWGCVILGLVLEGLFKDGVGNSVAAVLGFATCLIAHFLSLSGDTLEMMQAVLDTNFWLATHVVCVTLGYTATFVAGFLGIFYVLRGFLTRTLSSDSIKTISQRIYGIVCFATLLSFVGTVLGGIWADQSWGRFWGWDPKENGALMIVIWNALVLHARWAGMVKQRGMAVLVIGGNIVTAWSWFGVNMLSVGLHTYGFNKEGVRWLLIFEASQLVLIGLGSLPLRYWRSFTPKEELGAKKERNPRKRPELVTS